MSAAKPQPVPAASESDLPEGWTTSWLGDGIVSDIQPGFACGKNNRDGEGIAHLRPMNVSTEGRIDLSILKYVPASEANREERVARYGDVIFNNTNSAELVGKTAHYGHAEPRAFSNHMTRLRCQSEILDARFCAMSLHQLWRDGYFQSVCNNHVSQASVSRTVLSETEISLPPLAEQKRIVAKVEELLARVNAARHRLARVPAILKRFRQAVLAAACSGRLTADWRDKHRNTESAASRWRLDSKPAVRPEIMPELPIQWTCRHLREISERVSVGHVGPTSKHYCSEREGVAFVRSQNVRPGYMNWNEIRYITLKFHQKLRKSQLRSGDLLVVRVGANRGDTCTVSDGVGPLNCANIVFARPFPGISDYLNLYCQSPMGRDLLLDMTTGSAQGVLNTTSVAELPVPIPPAEEQAEVLRRVEALFKLADAIERRVASATARADKLTQAILAKAFRGELVPTEAELARRESRPYEPASALLARIESELVDVRHLGPKPQRRPPTGKGV